MSNVTYSSSHRHADSPKINILSKIFIAPDLSNHLVATVIHSKYLRRWICVHIHILHNIGTMVEQNKKKKIGTPVKATCKGNLSACTRYASPGLNNSLLEIHTNSLENTIISLHRFKKHATSFIFVANHTERHFQETCKSLNC